MILRDRDLNDGWTGAADGTLDERVYSCQNWRQDVCQVLEWTGDGVYQLESVRYFTFGMPFGMPAGDLACDGDYDSTDDGYVNSPGIWASLYDVRADVNRDGAVDSSDAARLADSVGTRLARGVLSSEAVFNRKGWRGWARLR